MSVEPQLLIGIRGMRAGDVPAVLAIEEVSYGYPWNERIFRDCLRVGYRGWVATDLDEAVVGYALLSVAVGEAHILNLCVAPDLRGQRVAERLVEAMTRQARADNAEVLMLEVRPSNKSARRLYKRLGFKRIATRPGYYPGPEGREDALLLSRRLVDLA
ncbi:alanine acetyltransferase [Salinisphaera orenii MK-B5]|uniref:[Ribosomal protein bS18]-alanine N-acetyltransferase n=2 Tax=Salinisphaera orenii TaxID=856731 RepID=A0A423PPP3_9GAMM|nr:MULTISPECIES: ribosomal protein S18-alanine N-acetyltransferase [Salinisphaera]ROO27596.1 alanine acetyltransferase [Salinisphaera orenii MK-B5]ROO37499.1 alanine acetyltransferase [Salinisphaera halophila YIM 95161]